MLDTPFESPEYLNYLSPTFPDVYEGFVDLRHTIVAAVPRLELVINDSGSASVKPYHQGCSDMEQYLAFSSSDDESGMGISTTLYDNPTTLFYSPLFQLPQNDQARPYELMQNAMLGEHRHSVRSKVVEDLIPGYHNSNGTPNSLTINPLRLKRKPVHYFEGYGDVDSYKALPPKDEDERMENDLFGNELAEQGDDKTNTPPAKKRRTHTSERINRMMYKSPSKSDAVPLMSRQFPLKHDEADRVSQMLGRQSIIDNPKRRMKCCQDSFKSYYDFAEHLDTKHDSLFRPWVCPDESCPWSVLGFFTLSDCSRHYSATHSQKSYVCKECAHLGQSRRFGRADALRRHVVENHICKK